MSWLLTQLAGQLHSLWRCQGIDCCTGHPLSSAAPYCCYAMQLRPFQQLRTRACAFTCKGHSAACTLPPAQLPRPFGTARLSYVARCRLCYRYLSCNTWSTTRTRSVSSHSTKGPGPYLCTPRPSTWRWCSRGGGGCIVESRTT